MSLMLRLQIFAIVIGAGSLLFDHAALGGVAPALNLLLNDLVFGAFLVWWAGSIAWKRLRGLTDDDPDAWYDHTLAVFWLGNAATVTSFWLLLPYGSENTRLIAAMFCLGPVAVEVIGSVRTPPLRRGQLGTWAPVGIPIGIVAWFVRSDDQFAVTVSLFVTAFCGMLMLLREFLQNAVDMTYAAKAEAEATRDAKARFLAAASHDLGQPLQAARLFFDQVTRARTDPERQAAMGKANWAFGAMEHQLRQMLDHLKLEARAVQPTIRAVPLSAIFARLAETHDPAARLSGIQIIAPLTKRYVLGDAALIERALSNFLANAVRHARARRVLIGARPAGACVRIWVVDDGRGVPEEDRAGLFQEYTQGAWSRGEEVRGGFGLGLASARRMAELMGGRAGHEPRWRGGSAFWIELPVTEGLGS